MVGMAIFVSILVGAVVGLQIFGMRVYTLAATKLTATADARKSLNALRSHIRSAKQVNVGNYANGTFSLIPDNQPQVGNALELYFAITNNQVSGIPVIYYQRSSGDSGGLYSVSNNVVTQLAGYITNQDVFAAEDCLGDTLDLHENNRVICITLQFYKWEYPLGIIGTNGVNAYNFYRLQTRVSRRAKQ